MNAAEHYPGREELFQALEPRISVRTDMLEYIWARYIGGRAQYATTRTLSDGRIVNACMERDSLQDAIEEVADALFNLLVLRMKTSETDRAWINAVLVEASLLWRILKNRKDFS